ncbi:HlyD family secretion protein [Thermoactinomyces mirandus]|nr:efflux RND transporter periplasmic adaptor subunit [Thermoactinomyces mirandus]
MLVNAILVLYALGMIAGAFYYFSHQSLYVHSEIAQVKADMVPIYADQTGILSQWSAEEGERVGQGKQLGAETTLFSGLNSAEEYPSPTSHPIVSPVSGVLLKSNAVVGEMVKPDRPIAFAADLSNIYILAYIDEKDIDRVEPGGKVEITLDAYKGRVFTGYVQKTGAMAGNLAESSGFSQEQTKEAQRVPVQISIDSPNNVELIPGMNAKVKIQKS